ncbi:hypothetical protein L841_1396 [Mycobacterium sp. MAC_080597_8934]|nr:hypothetical protein L841_1396 [Mycobacterium sp. MAC_080597_8934]
MTTSALAGGLDADLLLGHQRHVLVDHHVVGGQRRRVQGGPGAVTDQRGVDVQRDLGDPAGGVRRQQQRSDQQGSSEADDPACGEPQHDCSVHVAVPSS